MNFDIKSDFQKTATKSQNTFYYGYTVLLPTTFTVLHSSKLLKTRKNIDIPFCIKVLALPDNLKAIPPARLSSKRLPTVTLHRSSLHSRHFKGLLISLLNCTLRCNDTFH